MSETRSYTHNVRTAALVVLAIAATACASGGPDRPEVLTGSGGERILLTSDRDGDWEIFSINTDGSDLQRHTDNMASDSEPAWSPDGKRIVFSSNYLEGALQTTQTIINDEPMGVDVEVVGDLELRVTDSSKLDSVAVTDNSAGTDSSPDWSPDGSRIAFHSDFEENGVSEIYSMKPDGADLIRLTDLGGMNRDPSWSPDGRTVAFAHFAADWELYTVGADGTGVGRLDGAGNGWQPAWSPVGDKIVFASQRDGYWNLYLVQIDSGGLVRLTNSEGDNLEPVWSPTGDQIAFGSNRNGAFEIFVMDSNGDNVVSIGHDGFPYDWAVVG
jgi:Tol biopolymer transport system component